MSLPWMPYGPSHTPPFAFSNTAAAYASGVGDTSAPSFGSLSIGAADDYRHVIVFLMGQNGGTSGVTIDSATLGGNTMDALTSTINGGGGGESFVIRAFILELTAGTTATLSATSSANLRWCYSLYRMVGGNPTPTASPSDTDTTPSQSLAIPTDGAGCGAAIGFNSGGMGTATWTGLSTEDLDTTMHNANNAISAAHELSSGTSSRSISWTGGTAENHAMQLLAFGPL